MLNSDFVDLVFKVREKPSFLAAHRSLVAAAWPLVREDLRKLEGLPSQELRLSALAWTEVSPGQDAVQSIQDHIARAPSGGRSASRSPLPGAAPLSPRHVAAAAAAAAAAALDEDHAGGTECKEACSKSEISAEAGAGSFPGVLDVSSKMWGSYSIMRALLCHLYNKPVMVLERELAVLRVAAMNLGSVELARCCDDLERRPIRTSWGPSLSRASTPELVADGRHERNTVGPIALGGPFNASSFSAGNLEEYCSPALRDLASSRLPTPPCPSSPGTWDIIATEPSPRSSSGDREEPKEGVKEAGEARALGPGAAQKASDLLLPPVAFTGEARALPMAERSKPRGERSFTTDPKAAANEKPQPETVGSVRRVLSEIKRNMVESSRIIHDKTFQQIYEMVPGERGILGEGINGPVRMAKHRKTGREVAVKRISCVNLSEQRRQMLVSEVRIFLQVSHRNIVQLLEVYESEVDQAVLLIMELCTGKELFERLAERRWYSEFDAARVARQMLDAVSYLHSQSICHRDLKLENWLFENPSQEAKLKLCDFGFGQIVEPSVQLTATLGSLFYVAPEVLEGSYGLPCDMWSVGVIVYMMLAGNPPFDGKTDADVMAKIRQGRFVSTGKRWECISEEAKHFVRSMLRKDPNERLTAAEAAQHAWLKMECQPKLMGNQQFWAKSVADPELELPIDRGVIRDMWKFAQNNAITRAALGMLAKWNVTSSFGGEEDVLLLEQRFRSHDEQNTGKIDAESFISVLKETLHLQISSSEEKQFFERIAGGNLPGKPEDGSEQKTRRRREVNYAEFITLTKARRMANNTAAIREAFRCFDTGGDGYIKEDDMHNLLGDEFKKTIENYVDNHNGKDLIDYLDFANIISQEMAKKEEETQGPALEHGGATPAEATADGRGDAAMPQPAVDAPAASLSVGKGGGDHGESSMRSTSGESDQEARDMGVNAAAAEARRDGQSERHPEAREAEARAEAPGAAREAEGERDAQSDEEYDADAQSDEEEQLVNVKEADASDANGEEVIIEKERPPRRESEKKGESRFQSFSLSLAGSAEYDDVSAGVNRVMSMPSDKYSIKQLPGFHSRTLRPFYAARPVSNVVMGLIRGTSLYAKQSVAAKLATIIHTTCGWFFIMPNPKYHTEVDTRKGLLSKETGKFRFVAWWIHPRFVPQLRQWFERLTYDRADRTDQDRQDLQHKARGQEIRQREHADAAGGDASCMARTAEGLPEPTGLHRHRSSGNTQKLAEASCKVAGPDAPDPGRQPAEGDMGSPGDFRFSDVPKPEKYLHTYRDLHTADHLYMVSQLWEGTTRFLRSLFDENFMAHATISAGFHYPVRTQYATLHMQLRVNAGNICGEDGRGIEINNLMETLRQDRLAYQRDSETLRYYVTENVKVSLLAAASEYEEQNPGQSACKQVSLLAFELGTAAMPTIHDEGEEEEEDSSTAASGKGPESQHSAEATESSQRSTGAQADAGSRSTEDAWAPQIAKNCDAAEEVPASYLLNIQPSPNTPFHALLYEKRRQCAELFGSDPTHLYPLHVSVTGFFEASESQVNQLKGVIIDMLSRELRESGAIAVGQVICTKTGYVLYDMNAAAITNFAQRLGEASARNLGLHIRPKAVNHISLACNRPDEAVREKLRALYEPPDEGVALAMREAHDSATFDLVLSRLVARSSFERFAEDGPHQFAEFARIPLAIAQSGDPPHRGECTRDAS